MQKNLIIVLLVAVIALACVMVYQKLTQPKLIPVVINQPIVNQPVVNKPVVNQPVTNESENQPKNCAKEGEINSLSAAQGGGCCSGLTSVSPADIFDSVCNIIGSQQHIEACVRCGNEVCGKGENKCNCPADCK